MATRRPQPRSYSSPACYLGELEPQRPAAGEIRVKRIYDARESADGFRALVDRLWPRGVSRQRAALDAWLTDLAPSTALRQWFHRDPTHWAEFVRRYRAELRAQAPALAALRQRAAHGPVTLLYGARDPERNHALVLRQVLLRRARRSPVRGA